METNQQKLYKVAFDSIGHDASPYDQVIDEYGCAESVSTLINKVTTFPIITGTTSLVYRLEHDQQFEEIQSPETGCIIISATGTGNGNLSNGHTGIVGKNLSPDGSLWVMSNSSDSGLWSVNYTIKRWIARYETFGGMKTRYFRLLG